jgi:hypothetical protein
VDAETNKPIKNIPVVITHVSFINDILGIEGHAKLDYLYLDTNKDGEANFIVSKNNRVMYAEIRANGYYPTTCYFQKIGANRCSVGAIKNPVQNMMVEKISFDIFTDNGKIIEKSILPQHKLDIKLNFTKSNKQVGGAYLYNVQLTILGEGGIYPERFDESLLFSNTNKVSKAPLDKNYDKSASISDGMYIFKTSDGKNYGKLFFQTDTIYFFINPNENDTNLEHTLSPRCITVYKLPDCDRN